MLVLREADPPIMSAPAPRAVRRPPAVWRVVAISLVYILIFLALDYLAARFQLRLYPDDGIHDHVSHWFIPQGLTLGVLVLGGLAYLPAVLVANFVGCLIAWRMGIPEAVAVTLATSLGYLAGAEVLRHLLHFDPRLARLRDTFSLALIVLVTPLLVSVAGVAGLVLLHHSLRPEFGNLVAAWMNGHLIGLLTVTPFLLVHGALWARALNTHVPGLTAETLATRGDEEERESRLTLRSLILGLLWLVVIAGVVWLTLLSPAKEYSPLYVAFLVLIWIALQHGARGATASLFTFSLAIAAAAWMLGPDTEEKLAGTAMMPQLQIFMLVLAITGLVLGAVISERRRNEQVVSASEELLRTLINAMPDLVIFKDAEGHWLAANDFCRRLFHFTDDVFLEKTDAELAENNPRYRDVLLDFQRSDTATWADGVATRTEETIPSNDGSEMTIDVIKVPLFHPDGRRKGLVIIGRDITERKQAEQELDTERAYLSSAIDILPLPLAFFSPSGELTQANAASFGFVPGLLPRQWLDGQMLTPDTRTLIPDGQRPLARALAGEVLNAVEVILILPNGHELPLLIHAGPIMVNNRLVAVVAAFQDISAIKEADRAKDEFLGILSHELLTPLTDALGWTHAARETPDAAPQALDIIEHNVRLLHRVMTDLLDLSRIIHGKLYLSREVTDLWRLTEQYANEFMPVATGRRRTLTLEPPDEELRVSLDRERIRQVLTTLLDTALKGTDPGDRIILTGRSEGDTAVLVLRDTGRGLPPEALNHLFTPFSQAQPIEPGRGMGLGLALAKGLIELHGGRITADSPGNGAGCVFTIELPLRRIDE